MTISRVITFIGPHREDKPIDPFIRLIEADQSSVFSYRLLSVDPHSVDPLNNSILLDQDNVQFIPYIDSYAAYNEFITSSSYLFLSHNSNFSGKLSGNLCDAIRLGVPLISRMTLPVLEYFRDYGKIGLLHDMQDDSHANYQQLLHLLHNDDYYRFFKANMRSIQSTLTSEQVRDSLFASLDLLG
jgi:hypothetical protein